MRTIVSTACAASLFFAAAPAAADDPDPWFSRDKGYHFAVSATIASGGYVAGAFLFDARGHALIFGAGLTAAAGIGKEILDATGYGDPSWKDLAWDGIGMVTGLAVAWAIDLAARGVSNEHPAFLAPVVSSGAKGASFRIAF